MQWAEAADAELSRLRPKPGPARIEHDAFVTAASRRHWLKHPAFELNETGRCDRCQASSRGSNLLFSIDVILYLASIGIDRQPITV